MHTKTPNYRPDIDGLRAFAVLSVVIFHAFPEFLPGGFIGVDIFFVISGYLISTLIFKELDDGKFGFMNFYSRRIKRIFPGLLLILVLSLVFGWLFLMADEYAQLGKHIFGGASFIPNILLWREVGYFDNSVDTKPLLHLWSLGVEEQFYAIFPLLVWLFWNKKTSFIYFLITGIAISFFLNIKGVRSNPIATFYSPQTRFWELLSGSVLAWIIYSRWLPPFATLKKFVRINAWPKSDSFSLFGLIFLIFGILLVTKNSRFPGYFALLPVLGAILIIAAGPGARINKLIFSNKSMVWIGLISYPLYLWHWPLLSFFRIINGEPLGPMVRVIIVLFSVVLAHLTYRFIERPVRQGQSFALKIAFLSASMLAISLSGFYIFISDGQPKREHFSYLNQVNSQFVGPSWKYTRNELCESRYPIKDSSKYAWWFCMSSSDRPPDILLLGNSYANHLYPGFVNNAAFSNYSVLSIGTCFAGWVDRSKLQSDDTSNSPCAGFRPYEQMLLINKIIKDEHPKYVIIDGLPYEPNEDEIRALKRRIDFIELSGSRVILFTPHLKPEFDTRSCFARPFLEARNSCEVSADKYSKLLANFSSLEKNIKNTNPQVLVFDQNQAYCDSKKCKFKINSMPMIRDDYGHFSEFGSNQVMSTFAKWAEINLPEIIKRQD